MPWLGAGIAILLMLASGCAQRQTSLPDLGVAPAYQAAAITGGTFDLQHPTGKAVLLNMWATWCTACRTEMPHLQQLQADYAARGLQIEGISVDSGPDAQQKVQQFVASAGYTYGFALDPDGSSFVAAFHGLGSMGTPPETYLIASTGHVVAKWIGPFDPAQPDNQKLLEEVLA